MSFAGRSIQVVSDVSLEEQLYLYERARRLKAGGRGAEEGAAGAAVEARAAPPLCEVADADVPEKVDDESSTVYLLFMEASTRTRESIRNAAVFHGVKVNEFQAETSSFQKSETITDTMKMLTVYSTERSVFVIRSPMEGVCSWLQTALPTHAQKFGIPIPAFVNAGDGRNSHPVGELLDTFSILENCGWDRSSVHLALVGDLAHGRTAHSKVDGLKIFQKVRVDLVAPDRLQYPVECKNRMRESGFEVRQFSSVQEYLDTAGDSIANCWYFYQPQFKRCGDMPKATIDALRSQVSFRQEWQERLPPGACFFQTLPRDKGQPLVPLQLDPTPLNGWDRVASNAYFLHVVLLSMLFGKIGSGLPRYQLDSDSPKASEQPAAILVDASATAGDVPIGPFAATGRSLPLPEFMEEVDLSARDATRRPERALAAGAVPIQDGLVVDHIGICSDSAEVWRRLRMVRMILGWSRHVGSEGVYASKTKGAMKGVMLLPRFKTESFTVPQMKVLASIAPGCTVNAVSESRVWRKYRLSVPQRIYDLPCIRCKNSVCVANPQNKQRDVTAFFRRVPFYETSCLPGCKDGDYLFVCNYCKWPHQYSDIWAEAATMAKGSQAGA